MLLIFILIYFCEIFCCLRLHTKNLINYFFPLAQYVTSLARAKLHEVIDKFYFVKTTIEHFICSNWKPTQKLIIWVLLLIWQMADLQVASTKRLDFFCYCCYNLIRKNAFARLFSVYKTYILTSFDWFDKIVC